MAIRRCWQILPQSRARAVDQTFWSEAVNVYLLFTSAESHANSVSSRGW